MQTENEEKKKKRRKKRKEDSKENGRNSSKKSNMGLIFISVRYVLFFFAFFHSHAQLIRISPYFANVGNSSVLPKSNLLVASPDLPPDEY